MRAIKQIHRDKRKHWVGDGFFVQTLINHLENHPGFSYRDTDPFLLLDFGEPTEFAPNPNFDNEPRGVGKHPHKGFETVTVAYQGSVSHKDSSGGVGTIYPGDVQWMTAGRGVIHEEFHAPEFGKSGGMFSMAQLWVNLPDAHKLVPPSYQDIKRSNIPSFELIDNTSGGSNKTDLDKTDSGKAIGKLALIAGQYQDKKGAAKTFTPINVWDIELLASGEVDLDIPASQTLLILVQEGTVQINGTEVTAGSLVRFESPKPSTNPASRDNELPAADTITVGASDSSSLPARLLLLSGEPIGEPIAAHGPFVMSTPGALKQAFDEYRRGQFG